MTYECTYTVIVAEAEDETDAFVQAVGAVGQSHPDEWQINEVAPTLSSSAIRGVDLTDTRTATCPGLPEWYDLNAPELTDGRVVAADCGAEIEQTLTGMWLPRRCESCNAEIERRNRLTSEFHAKGAERVLAKDRMSSANLTGDADRRSLDRLLELYSETRIKGGVMISRYQEIVGIVRDFCDLPPLLIGPGTRTFIILHGPMGNGKTWLMEAAVHRVMKKYPAIYDETAKIWSRVTASFNRHASDIENGASQARIVEELSSCTLLALDNLTPSKTPTEWELGILHDVVDARYRNKLRTIVAIQDGVIMSPDGKTIIAQYIGVEGLNNLWARDDDRYTLKLQSLCDRLSDRKVAISLQMSGSSLRREK